MAGIFALLTMLFLASLITEASVHVLALYVFEDAIVDGGNTQPTPPHGIDLNTTIPIRWTNEKLMLISLVNFGFFLLLLSVSLSLSLPLPPFFHASWDCHFFHLPQILQDWKYPKLM
ncbi:hypothetical protein CsSME_00043411 [Camellia sinensis var. sinensis]